MSALVETGSVDQNSRRVVDENARDVLAFTSEMRNLSRTAALVDAIVEMHASGKWRRYETTLGPEEWRECEFDYFLIACDASYDDISRVLAWNRRGKELASAMAAEDPAKRRTLDEAAEAWHSPTGESLVDRAGRQGWVNRRGEMRPAPVPARARARVVHGVSKDELARQHREQQIPPARKGELSKRVEVLAADLTDLELRYVRDLLTHRRGERKK